MSDADVLEILDPADPDSLRQFTPGVYTALWSKLGVPSLDRFTIDTHDRLEITRTWYTPGNLPGWTAIDFKVLPEPAAHD